MVRTDVSSLRAGVVINCLFPHQILFPIKRTLGDGEAAIRSCSLCVGSRMRTGLQICEGPPAPHLLCFHRPLAWELFLGF